jgi:hypothetical protein
MTKLRPPMTAYRALSRIADLIGWDGCASVVNKTEWTMRKYADPDTEREISLRDAMRLDLAFRRAGGHGTPLFEAYATRLEIELRAEATDPGQIIHASREAARESGEALDAALQMATGTGDRREALREVGEAVTAFQGLYSQLQRMETKTS